MNTRIECSELQIPSSKVMAKLPLPPEVAADFPPGYNAVFVLAAPEGDHTGHFAVQVFELTGWPADGRLVATEEEARNGWEMRPIGVNYVPVILIPTIVDGEGITSSTAADAWGAYYPGSQLPAGTLPSSPEV